MERRTLQEEQRRLRLVLRGRGDLRVRGEVGEEGAHLRGSHPAGVLHPVKLHEAVHPSAVRLLGAFAEVLQAGREADLVEELGVRSCRLICTYSGERRFRPPGLTPGCRRPRSGHTFGSAPDSELRRRSAQRWHRGA